MTVTKTFSIAADVEELLDDVPHGHISETINEAVRQFFESETPIEKRPQRRKTRQRRPEYEERYDSETEVMRYPVQEISIDDL